MVLKGVNILGFPMYYSSTHEDEMCNYHGMLLSVHVRKLEEKGYFYFFKLEAETLWNTKAPAKPAIDWATQANLNSFLQEQCNISDSNGGCKIEMGCLRVISPLKRLSLLQISRFRSFLKVVYLQDFKCMLHNFESSSKRARIPVWLHLLRILVKDAAWCC